MDFADDAPYPTEVLNLYLLLLKSIDMPFKELLGLEATAKTLEVRVQYQKALDVFVNATLAIKQDILQTMILEANFRMAISSAHNET